MSDLPVLPEVESAEHIPAILAAPKPKKLKPVKAEHFVSAPATFDAPVTPTAAAPADATHSEETTMATTIENLTQTTADTAQDKTAAFGADLNARATDAMAKGTKMFADMNGFTKGNVEALVESGKLAVAGMQTMAQHQAAFVRQQFEQTTAAAREIATIKSPTEFVKMQGDFVRQQFDAMVAETSRSTEAMLKLAGEVVQPISNRVAVAVEQFKKAA